MQTERQMATNH